MRTRPSLEPETTLSLEDVMSDLEYGRGAATPLAPRLERLDSLRRPTLGGAAFKRAYLTASILGRIHPRLARRALLRLWFTPWPHPSALRPVTDVPAGLVDWSLPVDGVTLRGFTGGHGPTAVLLHGWAGRAADWRHLAADLIDAGWRVVAPDLPGHGRTAGGRTDLFELGHATAAVLRHERPTAVVTHSMGFPAALLALEDGAPAPERIVALAPGRKIDHAVGAFAARTGLPRRLTEELRRGIEMMFGSNVWWRLDVDRVLPGLDVEGIVVHDADDDEVPVGDARRIVAGWQKARLVETANLGHRRILRDAKVRDRVVRELADITPLTRARRTPR